MLCMAAMLKGGTMRHEATRLQQGAVSKVLELNLLDPCHKDMILLTVRSGLHVAGARSLFHHLCLRVLANA